MRVDSAPQLRGEIYPLIVSEFRPSIEGRNPPLESGVKSTQIVSKMYWESKPKAWEICPAIVFLRLFVQQLNKRVPCTAVSTVDTYIHDFTHNLSEFHPQTLREFHPKIWGWIPPHRKGCFSRKNIARISLKLWVDFAPQFRGEIHAKCRRISPPIRGVDSTPQMGVKFTQKNPAKMRKTRILSEKHSPRFCSVGILLANFKSACISPG